MNSNRATTDTNNISTNKTNEHANNNNSIAHTTKRNYRHRAPVHASRCCKLALLTQNSSRGSPKPTLGKEANSEAGCAL